MLHFSAILRDVSFTGVCMPRKYVSMGGWCGPALILGKLGLRTEAYPFDFSRCTLDGVLHFIRDGFAHGFYPPGPPPYRPECVGIWVLYRGQHTAFAHFDLNDPAIQAQFSRKMQRWDALIDTPATPVTFFRTISARDPMEEIRLIPEVEAALVARNPALDFRIVMIAHDQGLVARSVELAPLSPRVSLWALAYTCDATFTLFDRSQRAYADIVLHSVQEENWPLDPARTPMPVGLRDTEADYERRVLHRSDGDQISFDSLRVDAFPWRGHDNIALIDGVASVGGTCVGIGSTRCVDGRCAFCGNTDYHKAGRPFRTDRPFAAEEDQLILVHLYRILAGGDKIEVVEDLAHQMQRGAFEVICRIQYLTNSSVKIMDYAWEHEGE
ncbi:hypothetical protein TraAM80_06018 [Trypanosoma rangeli]|uniref:Papain-like cysteine peptidase (DUF1796) n=1 Tax=Trypanosoma rangeli TaxID=5698 RepID=A0A3R7KWZ0_TRYRA|nr:uncharacterized protein TraAM80_06018 [Trypanosoma rangeli]RNF03017.1 hypothetical protein TraAM80_06018 [Trypanosoma rangeli]|eukprot:RNF03017.1 hypothetical protein TraAM80_06018 [Trypanosoma rangeli]